MRQDYTHMTVILDRTGSMENIRDDTIGGFNSFLEKQKDQPGTATLTLVQFDTQDPYEVIHHFVPVTDVPELTREIYVPRAATPLLDTLGRGINDLEKRLAERKEEERPSIVMMVVITDGHENSSKEFKKDQIEKMIKEKTEQDDWQFVFLSADLAGIDDAMSLGMRREKVMKFDKRNKGSYKAWDKFSQQAVKLRSGEIKEISFVEED